MIGMIDSFNDNATGWARFSDEHKPVMRYRLARACTSRAAENLRCQRLGLTLQTMSYELDRVVFLMLNPSTADAFELDPTVRECLRFARLWVPSIDLLEVVNLFAFRSPYPKDLRAAPDRGDDEMADQQILEACTGAELVIAAWGTGGELGGRASAVSSMLHDNGVQLHRLGLTKDLHPKHPLARGKHRIPREQHPVPHPWTVRDSSAS
jgi:hypothetical protein